MNSHEKYRARALAPMPKTASVVPSLLSLCLEALAGDFAFHPRSVDLPPPLLESLVTRLSSNLEPRVTMPFIHDERYWRRACEEGRGWKSVDIRQHGGSWKQAFAELYVGESLRTFGVYPNQPPGWDIEFLRPPMDARHVHWAKVHPRGPVARVDMILTGNSKPSGGGVGEGQAYMPWRERFCSNAFKNGSFRSAAS